MLTRVTTIWNAFLLLMERGGPVMWPLLLLSTISVTLSVERFWFWWRANAGRGRDRLRGILQGLRRGDAPGVLALAKDDPSPYAQVATDLMQDGVDDAVAIAAVEMQRPRMDRFMNMMSTIITAAPMLGILGTVSGIIRSFELLGGKDTLSDPRLVSGGIAEALVATAAGLVVALITLFPYMYFRAQTDKALGRLESVIASAKLGATVRTEAMPGPREDIALRV
ncbi:MAG: MotA/TolQ/ExbB proton channel family protein [Phycisphaerales bacterium]|nr:MotA/TolQ/ExbB proton channel family protein [Phycisphaerales bacterium]